MGTGRFIKRTLKNEVGFVFDHTAKAEDLCRCCLGVAKALKGSPAEEPMGKNSLERR